MIIVFQVCFFVGIGFTLISFILGHLTELIGLDGLHFDFHPVGIDFILPLSPALYVMFVTVFGGMGLILSNVEHPLPILIITLISVATGVLVSTFVYKFIIKPLRKAQNTSAPDTEDLIGIEATVNETIKAGAFGEITYVINGNSFAAPAKATSQEEIPKGSKVSICWIENYVFYVAKID